MADGNIFISYRRGVDSNAAGRLYDRLERHFDRAHLFFDIDSIPLGVDFAEHIDGEVAKCDVQLVVIGPGWLEEIDRLQDPDDFVRIEIEAALKRPNIPVIPVLFEGAEMPKREDLPDALRSLVGRNAIQLNHSQFAHVVDGRLTSALRATLAANMAADQGSESVQDFWPEQGKKPLMPPSTKRDVQGSEPPPECSRPGRARRTVDAEPQHAGIRKALVIGLVLVPVIAIVSQLLREAGQSPSGVPAVERSDDAKVEGAEEATIETALERLREKETEEMVAWIEDQQKGAAVTAYPISVDRFITGLSPRWRPVGLGRCLLDGSGPAEGSFDPMQRSAARCMERCEHLISCRSMTVSLLDNTCLIHRSPAVGGDNSDPDKLCFTRTSGE